MAATDFDLELTDPSAPPRQAGPAKGPVQGPPLALPEENFGLIDPSAVDPIASAMEEEAALLRKEDRAHTVNSIVNEMVKSYGWSRSPDGDWSWDLETIGKSFKEDPIWSTIDWMAITLPVAKWGTSVRAVQKGTGAAGKALKAGEFAGTVGAEGILGRATGAFFGKETARAAQLYKQGPSRLNFQIGGRQIGLSNPITTKLDDEYLQLVDKYGAEVYERRAVGLAHNRERLIEEGMRAREASDIIRGWDRSGLTKAQMARGVRFLEQGVDPSDALIKAAFKNNQEGLKAYQNTWNFRNSVHESAFDTGLISEATYIVSRTKV